MWSDFLHPYTELPCHVFHDKASQNWLGEHSVESVPGFGIFNTSALPMGFFPDSLLHKLMINYTMIVYYTTFLCYINGKTDGQIQIKV